MFRRGARVPTPVPVVTSPDATLKTVCLRLLLDFGSEYGVCAVGGGGDGGTEKSARSWGSVSRIRAVMS